MFVFVAYLMVLFQVVVDLFRDDALSGGWKAVWILGLLFPPVFTAVIYVIARGRGMAERQRSVQQRAKADTDAGIRQVAGQSPASRSPQQSVARRRHHHRGRVRAAENQGPRLRESGSTARGAWEESAVTTAGRPSADELAAERTNLAATRTLMSADRTLMAWVRTSLSLLSFAFTIYRIFEELPQLSNRPRANVSGRDAGLVLAALGTFAIVAGTVETGTRSRCCGSCSTSSSPAPRSPWRS